MPSHNHFCPSLSTHLSELVVKYKITSFLITILVSSVSPLGNLQLVYALYRRIFSFNSGCIFQYWRIAKVKRQQDVVCWWYPQHSFCSFWQADNIFISRWGEPSEETITISENFASLWCIDLRAFGKRVAAFVIMRSQLICTKDSNVRVFGVMEMICRHHQLTITWTVTFWCQIFKKDWAPQEGFNTQTLNLYVSAQSKLTELLSVSDENTLRYYPHHFACQWEKITWGFVAPGYLPGYQAESEVTPVASPLHPYSSLRPKWKSRFCSPRRIRKTQLAALAANHLKIGWGLFVFQSFQRHEGTLRRRGMLRSNENFRCFLVMFSKTNKPVLSNWAASPNPLRSKQTGTKVVLF